MIKIITTLQLFVLSTIFIFQGCSTSNEQHLTANKELVKQFTELINNKQFDQLKTIMKEDFIRHSQATAEMPELNSLDKFINLQKGFLSSFSDQKVTIETLVAEGIYVAAYATYSGTNDGPSPPFPATNKFAELKFLSLFRIEENKIAELWVEWDNLNFLAQLGLFPPPEQPNN
jgi:steroid delta-isomerase-like uncharacterized protein